METQMTLPLKLAYNVFAQYRDLYTNQIGDWEFVMRMECVGEPVSYFNMFHRANMIANVKCEAC